MNAPSATAKKHKGLGRGLDVLLGEDRPTAPAPASGGPQGTTALPVGSVINDVTLSLIVKNTDTGVIGDFSIHQGTWSSLADAAAWAAWQSEPLVHQSAVVSGTVVNLTLPITSVSAGEGGSGSSHWYLNIQRAEQSVKVRAWLGERTPPSAVAGCCAITCIASLPWSVG